MSIELEDENRFSVEAASVASTLLSPLVKEPKNYDQQFYTPVVEHFEDFFLLGYIGIRNYILERFSKYIPVKYPEESSYGEPIAPSEEQQLKRKAFLVPEKKKFKAFLMGFCDDAKRIGSSHVKHLKNGFQISIPIDTTGIGINDIMEIANNHNFMEENDKREVLKLLHELVKGTGFLDLSKKVDVIIPTKTLLAPHDWFNVNAVPGVSDKTVKAFEQFITGVRMISAPEPKSSAFSGEFNKQILQKLKKESGKEDLELPPIYRVAEAEDKIKFLEHTLDSRRVHLFLNLIIPIDYAKYITQTTNEKAINPAWIALWLMSIYKGNLDPIASSSARAAKAFTPLSSIRTANKNVIGTPTPVRNKDFLSLDTEGKLLVIPDADSVDDYEKTFTAFGSNEKTGEFTLADPGKLSGNVFTFEETREEKQEAAKPLPSDKLIYVDWINRKLAYSNSQGLMRIEDIEGYTVPTTFAVIKNLDREVMGDEAKELQSHVAFALNHVGTNFALELEPAEIDSFVKDFKVTEYGKRTLMTALESTGNPVPLLNAVSELLRYADMKDATEIKDKLSEIDAPLGTLKLKHLAENSPIYPLRAIGRLLKKAYTMFRKDPEAYLQSHAVLPQLYELAIVILVAKYAPDYIKWKEVDLKERNTYLDPKIEANHKPMATSYVKDGLYMFPHQAKVDNLLVNNEPDKAILAIDAGGGKTFLILKYILNMLEKGKWHRPLIICPGTLLRNYVEEGADLFDGKLNIITVTSLIYGYHFERLNRAVKNAPPNTVVVVSFDFLRGGRVDIPYGTSVVKVSGNAEWLRQWGFDAAMIDESHFLRNESARTFSTQRVLSDIPHTTLATGTFITNKLSDVVNQMRVIDPSVFENEDKFRKRFVAVDATGKALKWRTGAEEEVAQEIGKHSTYIKISKKEWACLLPHAIENFYFTDMNDIQRGLYQTILNKTLEDIKIAMQKHKTLRKVLSGNEDEDEEDSEMDDEAIEGMLQPYLARLERFLTAPGLDPVGAQILKGKDRAGPKVDMTIKILERHIFGEHEDDDEFKTFPKGKIKGKVLIYTSYHNSADMIYESLPERLKKMTIRYHAENKEQDLARFKRDDNIRILVGVENSINTGQNLQVSTRIIRIESVWTPGVLEQGKSRVERPDPKNLAGGERKNIYMDWVCVDRSLDVTKTARLTSKLLSKAKFDEQKNAVYSELKSLPVISMTLDNLRNVNDFQTSLLEYLQEYSKLKGIDKQEMDEYREKQGKDFKLQPVPRNEKGIPGQAHILGVPYIPDMKLPHMEELHLQTFFDYVRENTDLEPVEFSGEGLHVHSQFGDGIIVKSLGKVGNKVYIKRFIDGRIVKDSKKYLFVILKPIKTPITQQLVEKLGQDIIKTTVGGETVRIPFVKIKPKDLLPDDKEISKKDKEDEEIEEKPTRHQEKVREVEEENEEIAPNEDIIETPNQHRPVPIVKLKEGQVAVYPLVVDGMPALALDDSQITISIGILKKLGFQNPGKFIYGEIRTKQQLQILTTKLLKTFKIKDIRKAMLLKLLRAYNAGKSKMFNAQIAKTMSIWSFYFDIHKQYPEGKVQPFFMNYNGTPYICFKTQGQPSARKVPSKIKVPGVVWKLASHGDWIRFGRTTKELLKTLNKMKVYMKIANYKEAVQDLKKIKMTSPVVLPKQKGKGIYRDVIPQ